VTARPSPDTIRLTNGVAELHVPVGYGPRVTHYGFAGGPNVFGDAHDAWRETPHGTWRPYGGHRLWAAPERFPETYTVDDRPPAIEASERRAVLRRARDEHTGLVATIEIALDATGTGVEVIDTILNDGDAPYRLAPWGITVVRPGGSALIPHAFAAPQRDALLPARTLALWRYTDLSDARFEFGPQFLRLRCDPAAPAPNKIGVGCERGWFAYLVEGTAFIVRHAYDPSAEYPDRGCSVEVYTEGPFCEVETLGPLRLVAPGEAATSVVRWSLAAGIEAHDDATLARVLNEDTLP
jgi:hypothetical protein